MEQDILKRLNAQDEKLEKIYKSTEKTRKYFLWTFIISLVVFFLPIIGLIVLVPWFFRIMADVYSGVGI